MKRFKTHIIVAFLFFLSSFFMYNFPDFQYSEITSTLFIVILALPSYYYLYEWVGLYKASATLVILSLLAILVEGSAIITGFPYGAFHYSEELGLTLLGLVPWTVAFAYTPILLGSIAVAGNAVGVDWINFVTVATLFNVGVDLVLDPAAVAAGLWVWYVEGFYYGVPLINFVGWLITGFIYINIFYILNKKRTKRGVPIDIAVSLLWILSFWTGYVIWSGLYIPAFVGIVLMIFILKAMRDH